MIDSQARAILWAQFRSTRNRLPRVSKGGIAFSIFLGVMWYSIWLILAAVAALVLRDPSDLRTTRLVLSGGLLLIFLYWQVIPVLTAASGASLEIRKLIVYPIPHRQLFTIEVLLRITSSLEMLIVLLGAAWGLAANRALPLAAPLVLVPFVVFNLCLAAGLHEILARLFARRRIREIAVFLLVLCGALPQLMVSLADNEKYRAWFHASRGSWLQSSAASIAGALSTLLPWSAAAHAAALLQPARHTAVLLAWAALAYAFGRWQFARSLRFDADAANSTAAAGSSQRSSAFADRLFRWPARLFPDPLAALIEKEIRFLARAPRFRLVFTMGFTFGLVIWLPIAGRGGAGVMSRNFLTLVSLYALLLLGDVCFWNVFGFDRRAAQFYFVAPVRFGTVLAAKNITAVFFVFLEITLIILACSLLRMPVTVPRLVEAYAVTLVITIYLIAAGNLTSTHNPRGVDPEKSMRRGAAGRLQALLVLVYPIAGIPVGLAYAARYAFDTDFAFYVVLGIAGGIGAAVYWVAMDSSVEAAERQRETIVDRLSAGDGPVQA